MVSGSIVLYHNDIKIVSEVIHSFFRGKSEERKLFLIDNSSDDELKCLMSLYPKNSEYYHSEINLGYGAGHNVGIRKSISEGFRYHVVLNPDLSFDGDTVDELTKFMDLNLDVGVCSPDIIDYYNGERKRALKLLPNPINAFLRGFFYGKNFFKSLDEKYTLAFADYSKVLQAPYLSGCFMFFRIDALLDVGLFDENIFMYYEDTDISRRLFKKYRVCCFPFVKAKHIAEKATHKSKKMFWITVKSAVYYFCKYGWLFDKERRMFNKTTLNKIPKI